MNELLVADLRRRLARGLLIFPRALNRVRILAGGRAAAQNEREQRARRADQRVELAALLGWSPDALPVMDGWAGSVDFLLALARHILVRRPAVIVEYGSGTSTLVMARALERSGHGGRLVSYDHDNGFAEATRRMLAAAGLSADVRAVPLRPSRDYPGRWYDDRCSPAPIDLVVIDGPPAWAAKGTRGGAAPAVFPRLAPGATVLLDDAARPGERANGKAWRERYPGIAFTLDPRGKGLLTGTRLPDAPLGGEGGEQDVRPARAEPRHRRLVLPAAATAGAALAVGACVGAPRDGLFNNEIAEAAAIAEHQAAWTAQVGARPNRLRVETAVRRSGGTCTDPAGPPSLPLTCTVEVSGRVPGGVLVEHDWTLHFVAADHGRLVLDRVARDSGLSL